jgi:hypothetical protein
MEYGKPHILILVSGYSKRMTTFLVFLVEAIYKEKLLQHHEHPGDKTLICLGYRTMPHIKLT